MKLYHVVAMARNRVIGKDNTLPWHFSSDLKNFKAITTGHTVIMGRKTFESIGRPLPQRENFVLSRTRVQLDEHDDDGAWYFGSIDDAIEHVRTEKAFIIGGAEIYRQTMTRVDGVYLTLIARDYNGDAFYPELPNTMKEVERKVLQADPLIEVFHYEKK